MRLSKFRLESAHRSRTSGEELLDIGAALVAIGLVAALFFLSGRL